MNKDNFEFQIGDEVEAFGVKGVISKSYSDSPYPLLVEFGANIDRFTKDGRSNNWHKEPSLKLISRKKQFKKVKKYAVLVKNAETNFAVLNPIFDTPEEVLMKPNAIGYQEIEVFIQE